MIAARIARIFRACADRLDPAIVPVVPLVTWTGEIDGKLLYETIHRPGRGRY